MTNINASTLRAVTRYLEARRAVQGHTGPSSLAKLREERDEAQLALERLIGADGVDLIQAMQDEANRKPTLDEERALDDENRSDEARAAIAAEIEELEAFERDEDDYEALFEGVGEDERMSQCPHRKSYFAHGSPLIADTCPGCGRPGPFAWITQ